MPLNKLLKPIFETDLIRIGGNNDGGYLIGKKSLINTKILLSIGIANNWRFEKDFILKNKKADLVCYDNQLSLIYLFKYIYINFIKIFNFNFKNFFCSIRNLFDFLFFLKKYYTKKFIFGEDFNKIIKNLKKNQIFLKIDIEGNEYRILNEIIKFQNKLSGLVIEFHNIDVHMIQIINFIKKFKLKLIHIHPNNYSEVSYDKNPLTIEITFEKNPIKINDFKSLPHPLDQKNNPTKNDIKIKFK
jgi:hypothetical protein